MYGWRKDIKKGRFPGARNNSVKAVNVILAADCKPLSQLYTTLQSLLFESIHRVPAVPSDQSDQRSYHTRRLSSSSPRSWMAFVYVDTTWIRPEGYQLSAFPTSIVFRVVLSTVTIGRWDLFFKWPSFLFSGLVRGLVTRYSSLLFSLSLFLRHAITISWRAPDFFIFLLYRASLYAPCSSNMTVSAIIDHRPLHSPSRSCGQFGIRFFVRLMVWHTSVVGSLNVREM